MPKLVLLKEKYLTGRIKSALNPNILKAAFLMQIQTDVENANFCMKEILMENALLNHQKMLNNAANEK
jgi:hypothetical protein